MTRAAHNIGGSLSPAAVPRRVTTAALRAWLLSRLTAIDLWLEHRRGRRALLSLNDAALKDIGLSRADAIREAEHR